MLRSVWQTTSAETVSPCTDACICASAQLLVDDSLAIMLDDSLEDSGPDLTGPCLCGSFSVVLLCGPSLAGKTSILYRLLQRDGSNGVTETVRSVKGNTGFLDSSEKSIRILDTPGHWGAQKLLRVVGLQDVQRLVVVVDSTQPVAPAADYLYAIIKAKISDADSDSPNVLIACHKSDHAKAKNARRIKLQLRSELIRLGKLDTDSETETGDQVNWEETMNNIPLCPSNISSLEQLQDFCTTGKLPQITTKR